MYWRGSENTWKNWVSTSTSITGPPGDDTSATPTVAVDQLNATVASSTNTGFCRPVDLLYDFQGPSNGRLTAQLLLLPYDHIFGLGR